MMQWAAELFIKGSFRLRPVSDEDAPSISLPTYHSLDYEDLTEQKTNGIQWTQWKKIDDLDLQMIYSCTSTTSKRKTGPQTGQTLYRN